MAMESVVSTGWGTKESGNVFLTHIWESWCNWCKVSVAQSLSKIIYLFRNAAARQLQTFTTPLLLWNSFTQPNTSYLTSLICGINEFAQVSDLKTNLHLNPELMVTSKTGGWLNAPDWGKRLGSCFFRTHMQISITPNTNDRPGVKSSSPWFSASGLLTYVSHKQVMVERFDCERLYLVSCTVISRVKK